MNELNFVIEIIFTVDVNSLVQVAAENAAALRDIASAYYLYRKASKISRK